MYCALRGDEFDAIARQTQKGRKRRPEPRDSRPRSSWVPRSESASSLDYAKIPEPIMSPRATVFSRSSPRKITLDIPVPHDKRFSFNPRDAKRDLLDAIRFKPFPVVNFKMQRPRDGKTFLVAMTPSNKPINIDLLEPCINPFVIMRISSEQGRHPVRQDVAEGLGPRFRVGKTSARLSGLLFWR